MTAPHLSIVVPCYNEAAGLAPLYERLRHAAAPYEAQGVEFILIDDGSHDDTWAHIEELCIKDGRAAGIRLSRNFGHQAALACGLDHCRGARVLVIDADLQDPPELLPAMMAKMDEGFDVVYGQRTARHGESRFKRLSAWLFYRCLNRLSEQPIPPDTGDFRLMTRAVAQALCALPERARFTRGLVSWLGFRQAALPYVRAARHAGGTHYNLRAMLRLAGEGLTGFSTRPLRLPLWGGALLLAASVLLFIWLLYDWLAAGAAHMTLALVAGFLALQALQWLMLGVMGGYIGAILRETKQRPLYLIGHRRNI